MPVVFALAALLLAFWFLTRHRRRPGPDREPADQDAQLLHLCLGDRALHERLIQAELARAPRIGRREAVARAYGQLRRARR